MNIGRCLAFGLKLQNEKNTNANIALNHTVVNRLHRSILNEVGVRV